MADVDEVVRRTLRHILTNLTNQGLIPSHQPIPQNSSINLNLAPLPSPSPATMVAGAISESVTMPTNPSMALTNPAVVTTTAKPDQHIYNSTGYLIEQDDLEYSE
uniref:Uncharacterized protein n=1 Tax=Bracon brevicornis TaxID=1563983 RepID=A0A6V7LIN9_9HYME